MASVMPVSEGMAEGLPHVGGVPGGGGGHLAADDNSPKGGYKASASPLRLLRSRFPRGGTIHPSIESELG